MSKVPTAVYLPNRLKFVCLRELPIQSASAHYFCIDDLLVYWNFFLDFGPLNLGQMYRFCAILNGKLASSEHTNKVIYYYSSTHPQRRTNAAVLIGCWSIIYLGWTAEQAFEPLKSLGLSFALFHDASPCQNTFEVNVMDCFKGVAKAMIHRFFNYETFDCAEYEHFEAVENGDLNWYADGKFLAFAGPHDKRSNNDGYQTLTPHDYAPYFAKKGVSLVVRLNKPYYDKQVFINAGIDFIDLYYLDGSNPPMRILRKFLTTVEATQGATAVHCKAGLGRTGTCIGCYIMKHHGFSAREIIAWMRICRPGSVIGPQQHFMAELEGAMWQEGIALRNSKSLLATQKRLSNPDLADLRDQPRRRSKRIISLKNEAAKNDLSGSMGSLALAGSRSLDSPSSRQVEKQLTQGDRLRARRARTSQQS